MNIPEELKYTKDHEWIKIESGTATVGITDFAQGELGDIVYVEIPSEGQDLAQHDAFGTIEAVKTVSDLFMPVSGKVTSVNPLLENNPEKVNEDPYGDGWLVRVTLKDPKEVSELLSAQAYRELIGV